MQKLAWERHGFRAANFAGTDSISRFGVAGTLDQIPAVSELPNNDAMQHLITTLQSAQAKLVADISMYDTMYTQNAQQYRELKMTVLAGKKALADFNANQLPALEAEAAAAYRQMAEAARQDGIELALTAGYQDAAARQSAITRICELQRQNEELNAQLELPNRTRDGEEFELLANCFGPEDVGTAMSSGASGVGLLRSSYMMLPGHAMDEQEQYLFYTSCLAAAKGKMVTVRTFDFGADRTMADAYQGVQSSKLGLRGIRSSLRNLPQMAVQICALMRAAAKGPLRVMFPMVTDIEDWDSAMQVVDHCRRKLTERGEEFDPDVPFGVMLSIPAACLTAEDFTAHGCRFFVIGTNDLTQYTHAVSRELAIAEHYYRPASPAMKKLIAMVVDAAKKADIPVTICGLAVGNAVNATQYLRLGLRSFSMSPQNLLAIKKALRDAETR